MANSVRPQFPDVVTLLIGAALFCAPWLFGFSETPAAMSLMIVGALLAVIGLVEMVFFQAWEDWIGLVAAAWLLLAPFVLGFNTEPIPTAIHFAGGLLSAFYLLWSFARHWFKDNRPHDEHVTMPRR